MDALDAGIRRLAEDEEEPPPERWELIFMTFVMIFMFAALITDRVAPDHVFVITVTFCMVTGIITISEGLKGFANEGVLTVMVRKTCLLFCVPQNAWPPLRFVSLLPSALSFSSRPCPTT